MSKPAVMIGTLDTKGQEVEYLSELIQTRGLVTIVVDPGVLDRPAVEANITREEVARARGAALSELIAALDSGLHRRVPLVKVDAHINEQAFADSVADKMRELMESWMTSGSRRPRSSWP